MSNLIGDFFRTIRSYKEGFQDNTLQITHYDGQDSFISSLDELETPEAVIPEESFLRALEVETNENIEVKKLFEIALFENIGKKSVGFCKVERTCKPLQREVELINRDQCFSSSASNIAISFFTPILGSIRSWVNPCISSITSIFSNLETSPAQKPLQIGYIPSHIEPLRVSYFNSTQPMCSIDEINYCPLSEDNGAYNLLYIALATAVAAISIAYFKSRFKEKKQSRLIHKKLMQPLTLKLKLSPRQELNAIKTINLIIKNKCKTKLI